MPEFLPPKINAPVLGLATLMLPIYLRRQGLEIEASRRCIDTVRQLRGTQTVIMPIHSDKEDPAVVFALSRLCGEDFYYLSARELFDMEHGLRGWFMQQCGAYSVIRGKPDDAESKEATISLVAEGAHKLIMFPEGDVTGRDGEILPLKRDGIRNMFEAQGRLMRKGYVKPVVLLPTAIYYEVQDDARLPMESALSRLEMFLGLGSPELSLESRIGRVIGAFVAHLESHYGVRTLNRETSLERRLLAICRHVTMSIARYAGLTVDRYDEETVVLYNVRRKLRRVHRLDCDYCHRLARLREERAETCARELDRIQQLTILASTLQNERFSLEVAWRLIDRLEQELTGSAARKGHRIARLDTAHPIDLLKHWSEYQSNPDEAVSLMEKRIRAALRDTVRVLRKPMVISDVA